MKTDPVSAATAYLDLLRRIMHAKTLHEARQLAARGLEIEFSRPQEGMISVNSGYGRNTRQPFVTLSLANPAESANPFIQMSTIQARAQALIILEAADAADSDGFLMEWLTSEAQVDVEQAAQLLLAFRTYRERLRSRED